MITGIRTITTMGTPTITITIMLTITSTGIITTRR